MIFKKLTYFGILLQLLSYNSFSQEFKFTQSDSTLILYSGNSSLYSYQISPKSLLGDYMRANYIHPLYGPNGEILTEDFPDDHFHHRGLFWAWHQVYSGNKRLEDQWLCEGISWKSRVLKTEISKDKAVAFIEVYWVTSLLDSMTTAKDSIAKESVTIVWRKWGNSGFDITFDITIQALIPDLSIGGSEDLKGYGGFSARLKLPEDLIFFDQKGTVNPQLLPVRSDKGWIGMTGHFFSTTIPGTIILMCEPDQLPEFKGWILRDKSSMQNAAFPGSELLPISVESPLTFRNRVVISDNLSDVKKINDNYLEFLRGE